MPSASNPRFETRFRAGMSAGALSQFVASPIDLVKVQMQLEGKRLLAGEKPRFKNTPDAFFQLWRLVCAETSPAPKPISTVILERIFWALDWSRAQRPTGGTRATR